MITKEFYTAIKEQFDNQLELARHYGHPTTDVINTETYLEQLEFYVQEQCDIGLLVALEAQGSTLCWEDIYRLLPYTVLHKHTHLKRHQNTKEVYGEIIEYTEVTPFATLEKDLIRHEEMLRSYKREDSDVILEYGIYSKENRV